MQFDDLSNKIIGLAIEIHKQLGPGLLESAYQRCLEIELIQACLSFEKEKKVDIVYKGNNIDNAFRADFIVEKKILIELKSVVALNDIHVSQILTYMKLTKLPIGLLINFNVPLLKDGIKRYVQ
jgi:GxxExxY protein